MTTRTGKNNEIFELSESKYVEFDTHIVFLSVLANYVHHWRKVRQPIILEKCELSLVRGKEWDF